MNETILKNEERDFIKEHLLTIEDVTEDILEKMNKDEGIIITTESGKVINIDPVWATEENERDCWYVRIYKSYEEYANVVNYYFWDCILMNDLSVNHIKDYINEAQ